MLSIIVFVFRLNIFQKFYVRIKSLVRKVDLPTLDVVADFENILIVAHPDDDVIFFYDYIKEYKPFVVCLTNGDNLARHTEFIFAMRALGVKGVIHDFKDVVNEPLPDFELASVLSHYLSLKTWHAVATHNAEGEYGHMHHMQISNCVRKLVDFSSSVLLMPPVLNELETPKFLAKNINAKVNFLEKFYVTQAPNILYSGPVYRRWVNFEGLVQQLPT
ncbi:PIG-L family deacetylase [Janthinobacterium sp. LB2P49]|uniref:PIG-L family deacetylase n=1 Tax=Janthinobacterium sp. LB2P49 TaxID=3424198 RepID=UPI003F258C54